MKGWLAAATILALSSRVSAQDFMFPPAPPPLAAPDTPAFEREQAAYERELRAICISKAGVAVILSDQARARASVTSLTAVPEWQQLEHAVADAAYASPVDMKKLEAAMRQRADFAARREHQTAEDRIALLRKLSPDDRAIYARRSALVLPVRPPKVCEAE